MELHPDSSSFWSSQRDWGAGGPGHVRCRRDGMHEDHRTIDNRFTFKPCIRDCKSICLVSFTFLNTAVTFQLPSNLSGRGTGEVLKCKEKISLSDCQVTSSSSLNPGLERVAVVACQCLLEGPLMERSFLLVLFFSCLILTLLTPEVTSPGWKAY